MLIFEKRNPVYPICGSRIDLRSWWSITATFTCKTITFFIFIVKLCGYYENFMLNAFIQLPGFVLKSKILVNMKLRHTVISFVLDSSLSNNLVSPLLGRAIWANWTEEKGNLLLNFRKSWNSVFCLTVWELCALVWFGRLNYSFRFKKENLNQNKTLM